MLLFKLGIPRPARLDDPMARSWVGYDPRRPPEVLFEQNRGLWRLNDRKAAAETHALFFSTIDKEVKFVAQIESIENYGEKRAVQGRVLPEDHPLHRQYVGQRVADTSRNPVR